MSLRRILYVSGTSEIGGAEISLLGVLRDLVRNMFEPLLALPSDGPFAERSRLLNVNVHSLPLMEFSKRHPVSFTKEMFKLSHLIRCEGVDLVHANSIYVAEQSLIAAKFAGKPCILHVRDLVPILGAGGLRKLAFDKMDKIIAISDAVRNDLISKVGVSEQNVVRIYNGVDIQEFNPSVSGESFRKEFNLGSKKLIGMVGRFSPEKGQELFLRAAKEVLKECGDVHFIIVGESRLGKREFEDSIANLSNELGLQDNVIFTGFRADLPSVIAALDVVVVPSEREPFGRVVAEAMAMEKPVVASASGAIPELVNDDCGILVEPGDIAGFGRAIINLLADEEKRERLGRFGREVVIKKFDIKRNISEIVNLYREILG